MGLFNRFINAIRKSKHNHEKSKSPSRLLLDHKENWKKCKSCKHFCGSHSCPANSNLIKPLSKACKDYIHK